MPALRPLGPQALELAALPEFCRFEEQYEGRGRERMPTVVWAKRASAPGAERALAIELAQNVRGGKSGHQPWCFDSSPYRSAIT